MLRQALTRLALFVKNISMSSSIVDIKPRAFLFRVLFVVANKLLFSLLYIFAKIAGQFTRP